MKTHRIRILPFFVGSLLMLPAGAAQAAITLASSASLANTTGSDEDPDGNPLTQTVTSASLGGFTASGTSKLVVTVASALGTTTGVTYGGTPLSLIGQRYGSGPRGSSIWSLDRPTSGGDFVITYDAIQSGVGLGVYALDNSLEGPIEVAEIVSTTATTEQASFAADMTMTTEVADEFVIAAFARNNFDNGGGQGVVVPLTQLFYSGNLGSYSAASAYQAVSLPGEVVTPTIWRLSNGVGSVIAVRLLPTPEPSVPMLFLLGGMAVVLRRRRVRSGA